MLLKLDSCDLPPPVTKLANQETTTAELLEHCRNAKIGKIITTAKQ